MRSAAVVIWLGVASIALAQTGRTYAGEEFAGARVGQATVNAPIENTSSDNRNAPSASDSISSNSIFNVMAPRYGAACNLAQYANGSIAAGSAVLAGSEFTSTLVGQEAVVWGAGAAQANGSFAPLITTVSSYQDSTHVTLGATAKTDVRSGPFEIGTLDTAAIQAAYNDAAKAQGALLIPPSRGRSCLTGTIDLSAGLASKAPGAVHHPLTIQGQGSQMSSVTGLPGQDVFQWPDGFRVNGASHQLFGSITGLKIMVDSSIDASSSLHGVGTFPNRVTGEAATGKGLTPITPPIAPGPATFTTGAISQSSDGTYDKFTTPTGWFTSLPAWAVVGQPLVIPSLHLNATITKVFGQTEVEFSPAYVRPAKDLSGSYLKGNAPPWHIGNCGIAFPATAGTNAVSSSVQMMFRDLFFGSVGSRFANHACGMFFQIPPYYARFERITMQGLFYGYIEALPLTDNRITWTPDTSHYTDINLNTLIPIVMYAGNHRILDGIDIYGSSLLSLGPFMLDGPLNNGGNSTVSHFYHECNSVNSGENQRWAGSQWTISGGSFNQCEGPYVAWLASQSQISDMQIGGLFLSTPSTAGLQLMGSDNVFDQMWIYGGGSVGAIGQVNDVGLDNTVINDYPNSTRRYAANIPAPPTGQLDGTFLATSVGAPFTSISDLFTRCADWRTVLRGATGTCSPDPNASSDGNIAGDYFLTSATSGNVQFHFNGTPMAVGHRIPQTSVNVLLYGKAETAGVQQFKIYDETARNTLLQTCNFSMTSSFAIHGGPANRDPCVLNLNSVASGHILFLQWAPLPTSASESIAWVAFAPIKSAALTGRTGVIEGRPLLTSCESSSVKVTGASVGSPVAVSSSTGQDLGAAFNVRASVPSPDTVTVYVCGTGKPPSLAYNVTVY